MRRFAPPLLSLAIALAAGCMVVLLLGHSPVRIAATMATGSFGSIDAAAETLVKAIPLLLCGIAVCIAFRAGAWNIGAEGQFIAGGIGALVTALHLPPGGFTAVICILAGILGGAGWAAIAALLRVKRAAPEVVTTILLNFVALHLLGWLVNGPLREARGQYPQTDRVPYETELGRFGESRVHYGIVAAVILALASTWFLRHTFHGLRLRAAGLSPRAALFAGIDTNRYLTTAFLVSGAIAGLAGAFEVLGVSYRLYERFATGYGYSGIAVALLAQLDPAAALASAAFFAALSSGAGELQRAEGISAGLALVIQAVVILCVIASSGWKRTWKLPVETHEETAA